MTELQARIKNDPGGGLVQEEDDIWVAALDQLDRLGERKPLTDLLRSDKDTPRSAREHLANLIERGVPKPRHRPPRKSYISYTKVNLEWDFAREAVEAYIQRGTPKKDALKKVAGEIGKTVGQLSDKLRRGNKKGNPP